MPPKAPVSIATSLEAGKWLFICVTVLFAATSFTPATRFSAWAYIGASTLMCRPMRDNSGVLLAFSPRPLMCNKPCCTV